MGAAGGRRRLSMANMSMDQRQSSKASHYFLSGNGNAFVLSRPMAIRQSDYTLRTGLSANTHS